MECWMLVSKYSLSLRDQGIHLTTNSPPPSAKRCFIFGAFVCLFQQSKTWIRSLIRQVFQTSSGPRRGKRHVGSQSKRRICKYEEQHVDPPPYNRSLGARLQGDQIGIAPRMFKALIGWGHPEFSTNRQQDAQEYLLHFINMVEVKRPSPPPPPASAGADGEILYLSLFFLQQRNCRSGTNPSEAFRFLVEEKIVCQQSQKAKYTQRVDYIIQLPVPMDQATNAGRGPGATRGPESPVLIVCVWGGGQDQVGKNISHQTHLCLNRRAPGSRAPA